MTVTAFKRRLDRLDGRRTLGTLTARDLEALTDDELDALIVDQLDALGIIDTAAYWAMPRQERWDWLDAHKWQLPR